MAQQILKLSEVKLITALSGSTIYRLISQGDFPKQIKLSERSSGWLQSEVEQWLQERIDASRDDALAMIKTAAKKEVLPATKLIKGI
jgi:prophage regulatory protein